MNFIGRSIEEVWEQSLKELLEKGDWVPTERGMRALELQNVLFEISEPFEKRTLPQRYPFNEQVVANHISTFHQSYEGNSIKSRLYSYKNSFNQIEILIQKLKDNWNTRRAVVISWDPSLDLLSQRPPCPVFMQFLIRTKKLHVTAVIRSNDAWLATVPDMLALTEIQKDVAIRLGIETGTYSHLSVSYHLYEPDLNNVRKTFGVI